MRRNGKLLTDRLIDEAAAVHASADAAEALPALIPRGERWHAYETEIAVLLVSPTRERGRSLLLRSHDLSLRGIRVQGRQLLYPGSEGALQLVRSDGRIALIGVRVEQSEYSGGMEHHSELRFMPLPPEIDAMEFLDKRGRLVLLDPRLRKNTRKLADARRR